jgi:hypothetical protein
MSDPEDADAEVLGNVWNYGMGGACLARCGREMNVGGLQDCCW